MDVFDKEYFDDLKDTIEENNRILKALYKK